MKSFFIRVLIGLSLSLFSIEFVFAQSVTIKTGGWSRQLKIVSGKTPIRNIVVRVKNNQIDISEVVGHIETLLDRSSYQAIDGITTIFSTVKFQLDKLCDQSSNAISCKDNLRENLFNKKAKFLEKRAGLLGEEQPQRVLFPDVVYRDQDALESGCKYALAVRQVNEMVPCSKDDNFCSVTEDSCLISFLTRVNPKTEHSNTSSNSNVANVGEDRVRNIMNRVKRLDSFCLRFITDYLAKKLLLVHQRTPHETKCVDEICRELKQRYEISNGRLKDLLEQLSLPNSLPNTPTLSNTSNICSSDYKNGKSREVTVSRTPLRGIKYIVKRNLDGSYTIPLAMEFEAAPDYQTYFDPSTEQDISRDQVPRHYFEKVQSCINESANPNLLGPNGERLNIEIQYTQNSTCIPKHYIFIKPEDHRSTENSYEADIDCPTIIHEVLHKLGLNDEYEETSRRILGDDSPFAYGCRVIQTNSVMSIPKERYCNIEQIALVERNLCQSITSCIRAKSSRYRKPCHPRRNRNCFRRNIDRRNCSASLLDPAHFNAILYGDCQERKDVKVFRECSSLAYQNVDLVAENNCREQKQSCESQDVLNRTSRQTSIQRASSFRTRRNRRRRGIR